MKPRAHLQQGGDTPIQVHFAGTRLCDTGKNLQERALASPIVPDDAQHFALYDVKGYIVQRVKGVRSEIARVIASQQRSTGVDNPVSQRVVADRRHHILLAHIPHGNRDLTHQITSAKVRSIRLK